MYRDLNDYEILYMICERKDDNFDILYEKYKPLILKISNRYVKSFKKYGYEKEDIMQIGYIVLYKSSYMYNVHNNSMFYTYFKSAFEKALVTEYRSNTTLKKQILNNAISYDVNIPNSDLSYIDLFEDKDIKDNEELYKLLINFKNSMSFELGCIFEMFYNGYNSDEISVLLDMKFEDVKKNMKEIKRHALTYKYLFLNKSVLQ